MDLDPRFRRGAVARRFSWLILAAFGWVLGAPACSPSNDSVVVPGTGGSGGTVDASSDARSTGGGGSVAMGGGGTAGAPRGGGGSAGTGGTAGTGGAGGTAVNEGGTGGVAEAAADAVVYVCPDGGSPTMDTDFDGVPDCVDGCPLDFAKLSPGICGCGISDVTDADLDGTIDCQDGCPNDPAKTAPGVCGCGSSDTLDTDNDGTVDCLDACPRDATRQVAGPCGCLNIPAPLCLAHRYSFNDAPGSTTAMDTGGLPMNGTVVNTTIGSDAGTGSVTLAGVASDQYVSLPAGIITAMGKSATIEAWMVWNPVNASAWQRLFDFGSSNNGAQQGAGGVTYLFLTPRAGNGLMRAVLSADPTAPGIGGELQLDSLTAAAGTPTITNVAVVVDGAARVVRLYRNGVPDPAGSTGIPFRPATSLSSLNDTNNWIGRSQFVADEEFSGTVLEFRIYSRALPPEQIAANFTAGPDGPVPTVDAGTGGAADAAADAPADVGTQ